MLDMIPYFIYKHFGELSIEKTVFGAGFCGWAPMEDFANPMYQT